MLLYGDLGAMCPAARVRKDIDVKKTRFPKSSSAEGDVRRAFRAASEQRPSGHESRLGRRDRGSVQQAAVRSRLADLPYGMDISK